MVGLLVASEGEGIGQWGLLGDSLSLAQDIAGPETARRVCPSSWNIEIPGLMTPISEILGQVGTTLGSVLWKVVREAGPALRRAGGMKKGRMVRESSPRVPIGPTFSGSRIRLLGG